MILDFGSQLHYLIALLPESILAVAAIAALLAGVFGRVREGRSPGRTAAGLALLGVVASAAANAWLLTVEVPGRSGMIAVDTFRVAANFLFLGATLLGILFAFDYLRREGLDLGEFYALVLLATVGMMLLAGARDLIMVFMGLELMSISIYVLASMNRRDPRSAEAGLKYFLIGAFASGFLLYGIALLFGATGSTNLALVTAEVVRGAGSGNPLLVAGLGLLLVGFAFKISAVPFHMWTPDAYEGAPTPVTGYMAAGVKAAAFLALVRIVTVELAPAAAVWQTVLWWLAVLSMIVPNLVALVEDNVKRMLAYSSIAHAGYLLVGVVSAGALGRAASIFYLAVYAAMTLGAFAIVYVVAGEGDRRGKLADYRGLGWRRPLLAASLVVFLLSLAGFPPTGGFVGKLYLLRAALDAGEVTLAITLVLTSFISYYYYLRVVWKMYFEDAPEDLPLPAPAGLAFRVAAGVSVLAILGSGVFPGLALRGAERVGADLQPRLVVPLEGPAAPVEVEAEPTRAD
ncbi:MAG: NADH-quinone oxidoreductase subunit N [Gemmatimonadota bacterium]